MEETCNEDPATGGASEAGGTHADHSGWDVTRGGSQDVRVWPDGDGSQRDSGTPGEARRPTDGRQSDDYSVHLYCSACLFFLACHTLSLEACRSG